MESKAENLINWDKMVGIIPSNGKSSVEKIREIREKLSSEGHSFEELNNFGEDILSK
jgi:hypothetical protein